MAEDKQTFNMLHKNGGYVSHWVATKGQERGVALCGAEVDRRSKRSYWVSGNSAFVLSAGRPICERCDERRLMFSAATFIDSTAI